MSKGKKGASAPNKLPSSDNGRRLRLLQLLNAIHVPTVVFSGTLPRAPLIFANEAAEGLLGYDKALMQKLTLLTTFPSSERPRARAIAAILRDPDSDNRIEEPEMYVLKKSGRKVTVKVTAGSIRLGSEKLIIMSLSDLTEHKRLASEREKAFKEVMRISKLADIGQLVAGVAHELNNPLTIIQGFAENIELLLESGEVARSEMHLQLAPILRASDRMARIIARMMRMVRQDDFSMTAVDLRDIMNDALHFMHHRFDDFNIQIERDLPQEIPARCDPNQVEQILLNLLSNAIHAVRKNAGPRLIRLSADVDDKFVRLKVHNNGPPIPEEIRDRIMSPFFTTKPVGEGTGLGLALSYGIMKAHGGDLLFTSSEDEGTEFVLHFPQAQSKEIQGDSATSGRVILVADDNEFARQMLAGKFKRYGYTVLEAKDGQELLELATSHADVECVLADLSMPRMPSEAVHDVRHALPRALVYALTDASLDAPHEFALKRKGINGVLHKPIDQENFADIIRLLEKRSRPAA